METVEKELQPAELKRHTFCIPKEKQFLFPKVGQKVTIMDEKTGSIYDVLVGSQYRLCMHNWFKDNKAIREGDKIIFQKENGNFKVGLTSAKVSNVSQPGEKMELSVDDLRKQFFDIMMNTLSGIENKTLRARVKLSSRSMLIEWGEGIAESEIIFGEDHCNI